jgi:hypothetical protein
MRTVALGKLGEGALPQYQPGVGCSKPGRRLNWATESTTTGWLAGTRGPRYGPRSIVLLLGPPSSPARFSKGK